MSGERQTYRKRVAREAARKSSASSSSRSTQSKASSRRASGTTKSRSSQAKPSQSGLIDGIGEMLSGKSKSAPKNSRSRNTSSRSRANTSAAAVESLKSRFMSSKVAITILAIIALVVVVAIWDNAANYGKAYGNVYIDGQSVAGMNAEQIRSKLETEYGQKISSGDIRIFASDAARSRESSNLAMQETTAQAEQVSVEDAKASVTSWVTSASGVRAQIPYDEIVQEALSAGRDGNPLSRFSLFVTRQDIPFRISYDDSAIEKLATAIDETIGDARIDATVSIDEGVANAVKGHDGKMVDREWLKTKLSEALLADADSKSFVAEVADAPSRTTYEQAQEMATDVNRAINSKLVFRFGNQTWQADSANIGSWTQINVAQVQDGYELQASIDTSKTTTDLVQHLDANVSGENVIVNFEIAGEQVLVKTSGSGVIPEVGSAVNQAQDLLYGSSGAAWGSAPADLSIDINESNAPEELTFDQAVDLGIITAIGEYKTEFSNAEGTENRNHNIKLAADLLNNSVCESNGGTWSFNAHSGDTNQDPPFASAGSIINGEYVDSIGGGICQVATTVFNAVYESGLDITERRNHSLYIESYPTGRDAAVSYPEMDLIWTNTHESDVLLKLAYTDTTLTASLYSTPLGYKVSTETGEWEDGEKYKTTYETDETLARGDYYLKTTGSNGSQISIVRTVTDLDGQIVKQDTFTSVYSPKDEVYLIGPGTDTSRIASQSNSEEEQWEEEWVEEEAEEVEEEDYA